MAWSLVKTITVNHAKIANTDQSNFPFEFAGAFQELASVANGGVVTSASGFDVIFAANADGSSPFTFERVSWSAGGQVEFHILLPTASHSTDQTIYVLAGNTAVTTDQQSAAAVWSAAGYTSAWHCQSDMTDSAGNNNGSVIVSATTATGQVGNGLSIAATGSGGYLRVPTAASLRPTAGLTIEGWIKPSGSGSFYSIFEMDYRASGGGWSDPFQSYCFGADNTGKWQFNLADAGATRRNLIAATSVTTGSWIHFATTYDGSTLRIYLNGSPDANTLAVASTIGYNTTAPLCFGLNSFSQLSQGIPGIYDELRFTSGSARSADWIATCYANQFSPSTFFSTTLLGNARSSKLIAPIANAGRGAFHQTVKAPNQGVAGSGAATPTSGQLFPLGLS